VTIGRSRRDGGRKEGRRRNTKDVYRIDQAVGREGGREGGKGWKQDVLVCKEGGRRRTRGRGGR